MDATKRMEKLENSLENTDKLIEIILKYGSLLILFVIIAWFVRGLEYVLS